MAHLLGPEKPLKTIQLNIGDAPVSFRAREIEKEIWVFGERLIAWDGMEMKLDQEENLRRERLNPVTNRTSLSESIDGKFLAGN